jgi:glycosyltransferase involved in cell wall biosynthesis
MTLSVDIAVAEMRKQSNADHTIHVAHLIESLGSGGAERLLYTNLKQLASGPIRSTVVTVFSQPDEWAEPIRALGVPVVSLDCSSLRDLMRGVSRMRGWLRRARPDLVHSHLWSANVIGRVAGRLSAIPVISSIHNPDHEPEAWDDGSGVSIAKRRAARLIDRWTARFGCERMIAVSDYVRHSAQRHLLFPLDRIELIYNPIDVDTFMPGNSLGGEELLRAYGIAADGPLLLNVGRVSPQKGMLYAIRAMPAILARHPGARLISIGQMSDRPWLAELRAHAQQQGVADRVHFLGSQRDVASFLRACDLFVFPSLYEGMGIALIEAMATGRACVASAVGPIPEVMRNKVDGWLVQPADADELAHAVCLLLDDPAKRAALGAAAAETALAHFHPRSAAEKLTGVYKSSMQRRGQAK